MRIFICAGEPSGDLHGANLIRALRERRPDVEFDGFGGERMEAAGCRLLYPLTQLAVMWFLRVLLHAPTFLRLLARTRDFFHRERPDAVVLIDYPGFNFNVAKMAREQGIPVFWFVPPQLWAWAGWRVRKMRQRVNHVLTALPFEEAWYRSRGVPTHHVGHPYFDELPAQPFDADFVAEQQGRPGDVVGLLPGSRDQEVERHLPTLLATAARIHAARPETRFLVACLRPEQAERVRSQVPASLPIEVHAGRTTEIIRLSRACVAVSGSVGLELLYHGKPSVVLYRVRRFDLWVTSLFKTCKYISLVNLLAGREVFPEYLTCRDESAAITGQVLRWLNDPAAYAEVCGDMAELKSRVALPGACRRAAGFILDALEGRTRVGWQAVA
jgi:lipid-A-disaccharide synthase